MASPFENPNQKPRLTHSDLEQFIGTENYYQHPLGLLYTDGVQYMAEKGGAHTG